MTVTVLDPADRGTIRCRECGKRFPFLSHPAPGHRGGRSGWVMLRAHVSQYHPDLNAAVTRGLSQWDSENALILAEGHDRAS